MRVRIKTMSELINEFGEPDFYGGIWDIEATEISLTLKMIQYLGEDIEVDENEMQYGWCWSGLYHKPKEKTAYYKWRLWLEGGAILEPDVLLSDKLENGEGSELRGTREIIQKEKISEAIYKVEGQE